MSTTQLGRRVKTLSAAAAIAVAAVAALGVSSGSARPSAGPIALSKPTVTGPAVVRETLQGSRGVWSGSNISYTYQWLQCKAEPTDDSSSKTCREIVGATKQTYEVGSDDLGKRIRFRVFAKNAGGTTQATSAPTSVVTTKGDKPAVTLPPVISGSALVGETLRTTTGTWVGDTPITYSYTWGRCDKQGNACKAIGGATKATYKVVKADVGKTLRTRVVARNARGQGDAFSAPSDIVQDATGGIITLPDGSKSVDVKDVPKGERLIVDKVVFSPNPLTSLTQPFLAQIRVKDSRGYVVRGAIVFIRSTPRVVKGGDNSATSVDGWVQYSLPPVPDFQYMRPFVNLQFFVKAYRKGDPSKGGVSGTALVQVGLNL